MKAVHEETQDWVQKFCLQTKQAAVFSLTFVPWLCQVENKSMKSLCNVLLSGINPEIFKQFIKQSLFTSDHPRGHVC